MTNLTTSVVAIIRYLKMLSNTLLHQYQHMLKAILFVPNKLYITSS